MSLSHFFLESAILLDVAGKDCTRYLNSRLTNDVKTLEPGKSVLAAALNPQGRTQALFTVFCLEPNHFVLTCDGGNKEEVVAALKKYIVADRVEVKDLVDRHLLHVAQGAAKIPLEKHLDKLASIVIAKERGFGSGFDLLVSNEHCSELKKELSNLGSAEIAREEQTAKRIAAKIPSFPDEINEHTLFAEADLTGAVSFKKGCYVGQEVVEKIEARGRVPHVLRAFRCEQLVELKPEDKIFAIRGADDGRIEVGQVVTVAADLGQGLTYLFGSVKNEEQPSSTNFEVGSVRANLI